MTKSLAPPRLNVNVLIIKEFILENVNDVKARVVKFEWFGLNNYVYQLHDHFKLCGAECMYSY